MLARLIVALRFLIVPAWIAAAIWVSLTCPRSSAPKRASSAACCRAPPKAIEVEEGAIETFGLPLLSRTMVVAQRAAGLLRRRRQAAAARYIAAVDGKPEARPSCGRCRCSTPPACSNRDGPATTLVVYLYVDPALSGNESQASGRRLRGRTAASDRGADRQRHRRRAGHPGGNRASPTTPDLGRAGDGRSSSSRSSRSTSARSASRCSAWRRWRSPTCCADRVLGWVAERYGLSIPREAEPVIVALLFGVLTDYLVFFVSDYRQRLREGSAPATP